MSSTIKPRIVLSNAFSTNMLSGKAHDLRFVPLSLEFVRELIQFARERQIEIYSIIGHESTAKLLSQLLSTDVPVNRVNYTFTQSDLLLVFTIPVRLPEGKVLSDAELREYASKLNVYGVVETYPTYYGYSIAVDPVQTLLREFADYLRERQKSELVKLAESLLYF